MKIDSRFQSRPKGEIRLTINNEVFFAHNHDSVAAALLAHSGNATRETGKGSPRTAYCMMGVCFDCLVEIDGRQNIQACMTPVKEGMIIRKQEGSRSINSETSTDIDNE